MEARGVNDLHDVLVGCDGAEPDRVGGEVSRDDVDRAVHLSEKGRVCRRYMLSERLGHVRCPDPSSDCVTDRIAHFGDQQDDGGDRRNVYVSHGSLGRDLDGDGGETAAETLEHLTHDQRARVAARTTRVEHDTHAEESDEETREEHVLGSVSAGEKMGEGAKR
jgi:hypothetical protein